MAVRDIVRIDEERCDGCGECVTACAEGAIALIDGKARLVSDVYCDGLGACLGHCPQGAITVERAEARPFDQAAVAAHLAGRRQATTLHTVELPQVHDHGAHGGACPGSRPMSFEPRTAAPAAHGTVVPSALTQWPVQMHLIPPQAPMFHGADVLLAADCVAYAVGDFHGRFLADRKLAIACPKLDENQHLYLAKLTALIDEAMIRSLTVAVMEVPCCGGLVRLAMAAVAQAQRSVPVRAIVVGVDGAIRGEQQLVSVAVA